MSKMAMYRNNTAYEKFLTPSLIGREGFELQVFPEGTPQAEITAWIAKYADKIRSMEKVYMDKTCYGAGEKVPNKKERERRNGSIWRDVETNHGGFDHQIFHEAMSAATTKATAEETIAEIVRLMLQKEAPTRVFVLKDNMGDHDLFGSLIENRDREWAAQEDAEQLRACLENVIGVPVTVESCIRQCLEGVEGNPWVFYDRHNKDGGVARRPFSGFDKIEFENICKKNNWPIQTRLFRLPIENLARDAEDFSVEIDSEAYSQKIREIISAW